MKGKVLKILFSILTIIGCSKDSDEVSYEVNTQTNQSTSNNLNTTTTSASTGSTSVASTSTGSTSTASTSQSDSFDRGSILVNYSENIIIPRYNTFKLF